MTIATDSQTKFVLALRKDMAELGIAQAERNLELGTIEQTTHDLLVGAYRAIMIEDVDGIVEMTKAQASREIDRLKSVVAKMRLEAAPVKTREHAKVFGRPAVQLEDGIYKKGEQIIKVVKAVHGSGNQYGKVLNTETMKFEYVAGLMRGLRPEDKMSLAEAVEFGKLYGQCCNCGRTLTNETSIERGIGPVCSGYFAA